MTNIDNLANIQKIVYIIIKYSIRTMTYSYILINDKFIDSYIVYLIHLK